MNLQTPEILKRFWALRDSGSFPHLDSDFVAWMAGHCSRENSLTATEAVEAFLTSREAKLFAAAQAD